MSCNEVVLFRPYRKEIKDEEAVKGYRQKQKHNNKNTSRTAIVNFPTSFS
jgi:hypothetical protein